MPRDPLVQRILLVEDEPVVRFAIATYLDDYGFAVDEAEDFPAACRQLAENDYDVVLTDLRLGGESETEGLDVIRLAREKAPQPMTILLTAWGSSEVQAEAAALGVDHYLQKPIELSIIVDLIENYRQKPTDDRS